MFGKKIAEGVTCLKKKRGGTIFGKYNRGVTYIGEKIADGIKCLKKKRGGKIFGEKIAEGVTLYTSFLFHVLTILVSVP